MVNKNFFHPIRVLPVIIVLLISLLLASISLALFQDREWFEVFPMFLYVINDVIIVLLSACFFFLSFAIYKDNVYENRPNRLINLFLSLSILLLLVVCLDIYILFFRYDTSGPISPSITHVHWFKKYAIRNKEGFWERDLSSYYGNTSEQIVIAAVGDSFTLGQGVKGKKLRFTDRLESKLRSSFGDNIAVLNFGLGGASTKSEIETIQLFVSRVHPKIVLLCYLANDIQWKQVFKVTLFNTPNKFTNSIILSSPTLNWFYWRIIGPLKYRDIAISSHANLLIAYLDDIQFQRHIQDIQSMISTTREIGAKPVFIILPYPLLWEKIHEEWRDHIYGKIEQAVQKTGTPVLNLKFIEKELPLTEFQVNPMDGHPNAHAHEMIAEEIYLYLKSSVFSNDVSK